MQRITGTRFLVNKPEDTEQRLIDVYKCFNYGHKLYSDNFEIYGKTRACTL